MLLRIFISVLLIFQKNSILRILQNAFLNQLETLQIFLSTRYTVFTLVVRGLQACKFVSMLLLLSAVLNLVYTIVLSTQRVLSRNKSNNSSQSPNSKRTKISMPLRKKSSLAGMTTAKIVNAKRTKLLCLTICVLLHKT